MRLQGLTLVGFGGLGRGDESFAVLHREPDDLRVQRGAAAAVHDDAQGVAARAVCQARGEGGVVGKDGADAGEKGVAAVAELAMDGQAGEGRRNPPGVAPRGSDFAVQGHGRLQDDPGQTRRAVLEEGGVEGAGLGLPHPDRHAHAARPHRSSPRPATRGSGSVRAATTRITPASSRASAQGGVRPWWAQGSRDT